MRRILSLCLCLLLLLPAPAPAFADTMTRCAVLGADLNEQQIAAVYGQFGIPRGTVMELTLTNAEERHYLEGFVADSVIGTRSISCVYVELLPSGSGISASTGNITWCTGDMYASALATAGVTDARIIVAAPFEVSGTAALAGVYKAYEEMTGVRLDDAAKRVSTQELTVTGGLAQDIGSEDSSSIVGELKLMLDETKNMSDEELGALILRIAARYNVRLTDTQVGQLISLCRSMEKLNPDQLKQRESVRSFMETLSEFMQRVREFLDKF